MVSIQKDAFYENLAPIIESLNTDDNSRLTLTISKKIVTLKNEYSEVVHDSEVDFDGEFIMDINGLILKQTLEAIQDDTLLMKFSTDANIVVFDSKNFEDQKTLITLLKRR